MSSFTDRCELEDESDRLELVRSSQFSLAYDRRTGRLLGQVCYVGGTELRDGFVRLLSAAGYVDVHSSTITLEEVH